MKFSQLLLSRYGNHTDQNLPLREGAAVHMIVGPNEAGKSTMREALADYLFGIHVQTRFAFTHNPQDLRIEGVFENAGATFAAARIKRAKNTVVDSTGAPFDPDPIAAAVGATSRATYERMYSLDRDRLTLGGREMLENKDDTSKLLFQVASGLSDLTVLLDALEAEADTLYATRKSEKRAYWTAHAIYEQAKKDARDATLRKPEWRRRNEAEQDALTQLEAIRKQSTEIDQELAGLRRLRTCAPHLRSRDEFRRERELLGEVYLLPPDAAQTFASNSQILREAEQDEVQNRGRVEETVSALKGVTIESVVLDAQDLIAQAAALAQRTIAHDNDVGVQEARALAAQREAIDCGRRLGWGEIADPDTLRQKVPSRVATAEIQKLQAAYATLKADVQHANQTLEQARETALRRREEAAALTASEISPAVRLAADQARALGDTEATTRKYREAVLRAEMALQAQLQLLAPWSGSADQLLGLSPPPTETAEQLLIEQARLRARSEAVQANLDTARAQLRATEQDLAGLGDNSHLVTSQEVMTARAERDQAWPVVVAAERRPEDLDGYQALVVQADSFADRRYEGSDHAHRYDALVSRRREQIAQAEKLDEELQTLGGNVDQLDQQWAASMTETGLGALPATGYVKWRQNFEAALSKSGELSVQRDLEQSHQAQIDSAADALRQALSGGDQPTTILEAAAFPTLLQFATNLLDKATRAKGALDNARKAAIEAEGAIGKAQRALQGAEQALTKWSGQWTVAVEAAGLPATISVEAAATVLDEFPRIEQALQSHREASGRVAGMNRDLLAFSTEVKKASDACGEVHGDSPRSQLQNMQARLKVAQAAASQRANLESELGQQNQTLKEATERRQRAEHRLKPLLEAAEVVSLEELQLKIEKSDRARAIDAQVAVEVGKALAAADGVDLEVLSTQLQDKDLNAISARVLELERLSEDLDEKRESASVLYRDAQRECEKMDGSAAAIIAESDRQMAVAELVSTAERYVEVRATLLLLRHGINRYREMNKDPLLQRASAIFGQVTLGEYRRLEVDADDRKPQLIAEKPDGKTITLDAMSEGTSQQLFFALRLAAVEAHLDGGGAQLPFIADDILMSFDDERAAAGFKLLAELSRKTQVFYLSHHRHLIPVAHGALGDTLDVLALGRWDTNALLRGAAA